MNTQRDRSFPATSIGRSSGARVQQASVHDAHPLLSPGPASATSPPSSDSANGAPKYLPYTPRQRVAAAATTTGTIVHPPPSPLNPGNATTKLQLMHLKAAAQNLGLDTSTIGWGILEKLVGFNEGEEWSEIWGLLTSGKATLLLPLEQQSNERFTLEFIRDHIVVVDNASVVTSSGLRGALAQASITLRSTLSPTSKLFQDILSPISRSTAFSLLPPLPTVSEQVPYPKLAVQSGCTTLPLPPRAQASSIQKPPLPPRPGRTASGSSTASRIPNPFASLFGGSSSKGTPATSSVNLTPASPPASIRSFDSSTDSGNPVDVLAYTIDRKIVRNEVAKEINKGLRAEIKRLLLGSAPNWVVDRAVDFTTEWMPFVRVRGSKRGSSDHHGGERAYQINILEENLDDAADRVQEFLAVLEEDLRNSLAKRRSSIEGDTDGEKGEKEAEELDGRVREIMELVERVVCSLFYERLFMQPTTDDASHDEALTSRIAALNKLDLTLGHLDVLVGDNGPDVEVVVNACGEMLNQLDPCRCPADKAAILVAAHKVVVDGLSRLPPIRLKGEGDTNEVEVPVVDGGDNLLTARPTNPEPTQSDAARPGPDGKQAGNPKPLPAVGSREVETGESQPPSPLQIPTANLPPTSPPNTGPSHAGSAPTPVAAEPSRLHHRPSALDLSDISSTKPRKPPTPTPVSGDILLPMLIFSVAKANPPRLLSNLLYTQRFRNRSLAGEESYCLINLMAVAEFLENVDLESLGLGEAGRVVTADLTPIPLGRSPVTSETPLAPGTPGSEAVGLRGRMEQQVDAIADSANKVITGVVDSSFGILRSFLPNQQGSSASQVGGSRPPTPGDAVGTVGLPSSWKSSAPSPRAGFGLLRRTDSSGGGGGFSIANLAAALPTIQRSRANSRADGAGEEGQQLVDVSRPSSRARSLRSNRSKGSLRVRVGAEGETSESESLTTTSDSEDDSEDSEEDDSNDEEGDRRDGEELRAAGADARSIKSFESMLAESSRRSRKRKGRTRGKGDEDYQSDSLSTALIPNSGADMAAAAGTSASARKSLSDRLAKVSGLASSLQGASSSQDLRSMNNPSSSSLLLQLPTAPQTSSPVGSRSPSPLLKALPLPPPHTQAPSHSPAAPSSPMQRPQLLLAPPIQKFVDCNPGDLRLSEIGELLRDYRRIVEGVRSVGGFSE